MHSALTSELATLSDMAKDNKKPSGAHKTKRINVAIPEEWHALLRKIAAHNRQPLLYALVATLAAEAERLGLKEIPAFPWEENES